MPFKAVGGTVIYRGGLLSFGCHMSLWCCSKKCFQMCKNSYNINLMSKDGIKYFWKRCDSGIPVLLD